MAKYIKKYPKVISIDTTNPITVCISDRILGVTDITDELKEGLDNQAKKITATNNRYRHLKKDVYNLQSDLELYQKDTDSTLHDHSENITQLQSYMPVVRQTRAFLGRLAWVMTMTWLGRRINKRLMLFIPKLATVDYCTSIVVYPFIPRITSRYSSNDMTQKMFYKVMEPLTKDAKTKIFCEFDEQYAIFKKQWRDYRADHATMKLKDLTFYYGG